MAQNDDKIDKNSDVLDLSQEGSQKVIRECMECPICLQTCIHPARLSCGHIFCFLCVKGVAYKNRRCPMCRREIPPEFLDHPQLVHGIEDICKSISIEDGYQWFYEGRNGWWQYDERTSQEIEDAYKIGEKLCTILVAGYVYIVDFEAMLQQRQNDPSRRRHVKRDLASIPKKGVAGLRIEENIVLVEHESERNAYQRSYSTNFISTITSTDAAIRIASDIISSTLAHADEASRSARIENNIDPNNRQHRQLLEESEDVFNTPSNPNIMPTDCSNLFSQTFEDFRSLTLQNVVDSSDSEDENHQIIL